MIYLCVKPRPGEHRQFIFCYTYHPELRTGFYVEDYVRQLG